MKLIAELDSQEWDVVANALGHRPFNEVAALIQKLRTQLEPQARDAMAKAKGDTPAVAPILPGMPGSDTP